jgi:hypothetical protein
VLAKLESEVADLNAQGSILQNSISAKNFPIEFHSQILDNLPQKTTAIFYLGIIDNNLGFKGISEPSEVLNWPKQFHKIGSRSTTSLTTSPPSPATSTRPWTASSAPPRCQTKKIEHVLFNTWIPCQDLCFFSILTHICQNFC